jgi:hypothetical protein
MAVRLDVLKARHRIFVDPIFKIAYKEEIALKGSIPTCSLRINDCMDRVNTNSHPSLDFLAPL